MTAIEILKEWLKYSDYSPGKQVRNVLSSAYYLHRCNEHIEKLSSYDHTGTIAVLYAKREFTKLASECKVKLVDVLANPDYLSEEKQMWATFNSSFITDAENQLLDGINALVEQVASARFIGERNRDAEREVLYESIEAVCEQLDKCNVDLHHRGGKIAPTTNFSAYIHVFNSLAECLLAIEQAKDGMYLCYVNNNGTADGYFGFYIKSNGNLLSINERVNEAYPGQHKRSRNGRWSEDKKFNLFPYNFIFSFSDYDYKGYATKHVIDNDALAFLNLSAGAYLPLLLAMVLLNNKYADTETTEMPLKYVDSLLPVNISSPALETMALIVPDNSAVAQTNSELNISMTTEGVKNGEYAAKYNYSDNQNNGIHYSELGYFPTDENPFVKLYAEGYELAPSFLLESNRHIKRLSSPEDAKELTPDCEFVGTENRMGMIAYQRARQQLAEYIREKMYEEYVSFGKDTAVRVWWQNILQEKKEDILHFCFNQYQIIQTEGKEKAEKFFSIATDCKGAAYHQEYWKYPCPYNEVHDRHDHNTKYDCIYTSNLTSIFFTFTFRNYLELAQLVGEENIPKILKYWTKDRRYNGNHLLNATDPVWDIGTPFERNEQISNRRYWTKSNWRDHYFHNSSMYPDWSTRKVPESALEYAPTVSFDFAIGFSKRGLAKFLKDEKYKEEK